MASNGLRYPYDKWFSRNRRYRLRRGTDFYCQPHSMSVLLREAAAKRGVRVSVFIDGNLLTVQNLGEK